MNEQHYVYWIHLPDHTDISTEGYIGISKRPNHRFWEHRYYKKNPKLSEAFDKEKDIVHTVLVKGTKEYCLEIEQKLRPQDNIGWNIMTGGGAYPVMNGTDNHMFGQKRPEVGERNKELKSMKWIVTNPQGEVFHITNLKQFCRDNNLIYKYMISVAKGKYKQHKNWCCQYNKEE